METKKITSKEFLLERMGIYKEEKSKCDKGLDALLNIKDRIEKLVRQHDEDNIDFIIDLSLDFWNQLYLTKISIGNLGRDAHIAIMEYKLKCLKNGEDKRDVKDRFDLLKTKYVQEADNMMEAVRTIGTILTMTREETRKLIGNKRAMEHINL